MKKEELFNYDDEDFQLDDLLIFIDEIIEFKEIIKETSIATLFNNSLKKFLISIKKEFDLEEEDLKSINSVLDELKETKHDKLVITSFWDLTNSLTQEIENQPNTYEQYKIFIQNKSEIIDLINDADLERKGDYDHIQKLGKYLINLFYNISLSIFLESEKKSDNGDYGIIKLYFDGKENKKEIKMIDKKKYNIYEDEEITELREGLIDIILEYCEKFIEIYDSFSIQYLIFILIKRLYFYNNKKYDKKAIPILANSLVNMCFFEKYPLDLIKHFINKIIKSQNEEDSALKKSLIKNINEVKDEEDFLYQYPKSFNKNKEEKKEEEEEEDEDDEKGIDKGLSSFNNEVIDLIKNDSQLGILNCEKIKSGNKFVFYEEINQEFGVLDFVLKIEELDINITITDETEGKEIFKKEKFENMFNSPMKIVMLFTSPRVLKFELDNSYSWVKSKTIKYKTNIFYPKYPYAMGHQVLVNDYRNSIINNKNKILKSLKKDENKKIVEDEANQLLILKIDGEN